MEWRDIKDYEGYYQVSDTGLVRAVERTITFSDGRKRKYPEKILPTKEWFHNGKGYLMVTLTKSHKSKGFSVHRLVAEAFIPNPYNYPQVNHKDEDKSNNASDNLEWCDSLYNIRYSMSVSVTQYDKEWNTITIWSSIADAAESLNIPSPNIINCCKKKARSAGGFFWAYTTDKSMTNDVILSENESVKKRAKSREYYYANIEIIRERARLWYRNHKDEQNKKRKERYWRDPEKARQKGRRSYQKNIEKCRAQARERYKISRQKTIATNTTKYINKLKTF